MRKYLALGLFLALLTSPLALAQPIVVGGSTYILTAANVVAALVGQNVVATTFNAASSGGQFKLNDLFAIGTGYNTTGDTAVRGNVANGASAIAVPVSNNPALSTTGAEIMAWYPDNGSTKVAFVDKDGAIKSSGTATAGSFVLTAGSGTVTVLSGAHCVCSVDTAFLACQISVSGTTATITVTTGGSNTVSYVCL